MNNERSEEAVSNLVFTEVILKSSFSDNDLNLNGHYDFPDELIFQTYADLTSIGETILTAEEDGEPEYEYIYTTSIGQRLIEKGDSDEDFEILAEIKAEFVAVYLAEKKLHQDCLEVFGDKNVMFNVWPFWREFVHSQCRRMGIKPFPVKFLRAGGNSKKAMKKIEGGD